MRSNEPERLVEALASPDWPMRAEAIVRLEGLGDEAIPALVGGIGHADPRGRAGCVALMDHLADERCSASLKSSLRDESAHVRRHAVHSIGCQRCKALPIPIDMVGLLIERVLHDPSSRVRRVAVHQLGLQGHDLRAITILEGVLRDEPDRKLRSRAEHALRVQRASA